MCCAGQPVILAGDFNVEPTVIPSLAKGISDGHWVDLEQALFFFRGVPPFLYLSVPVWTKIRVLVGISF